MPDQELSKAEKVVIKKLLEGVDVATGSKKFKVDLGKFKKLAEELNNLDRTHANPFR